MFINRDFSLSKEEDFNQNVRPKLNAHTWATPIYGELLGMLIGWKIQGAYE